MHIEQLSLESFQEFVLKHPLRNYCQTVNYAMLMGQYDFDCEFLGFVDNNRIYAASLILTKKIGFKTHFAYAPKGFLIDYTDKELLLRFISEISSYYKKRGFVFIKINPEIAIGEINTKDYKVLYNNNYQLNQVLQNNGFQNVGVNQDFDETLCPTITGIVPLKNFSFKSVSKNTRNKIRKGMRKGLHTELGDISHLKSMAKFMPRISEYYYVDFYNAFNKNELVDLFLTYIEPEEYLLNVQEMYANEQKKNNILSRKMLNNSSNRNINAKMNSDKALLAYKNDIVEASKMLNDKEKVYIGIALVVKDGNRVHIIASGYDKKYKHFVPNYYLYYSIMDYYKDKYAYVDLNGLSNRFSKDSPYHGLNRFKIGFNPRVYELIGEFDLILNPGVYKRLYNDDFISKIYRKLN